MLCPGSLVTQMKAMVSPQNYNGIIKHVQEFLAARVDLEQSKDHIISTLIYNSPHFRLLCYDVVFSLSHGVGGRITFSMLRGTSSRPPVEGAQLFGKCFLSFLSTFSIAGSEAMFLNS